MSEGERRTFGELGTRVAVAAVAIPIVLALIWFGGWFIGIPLAVFAVLGSGEAARLGERVGSHSDRLLAAGGAAALVLTATWQVDFTSWAPWAVGILALSAPVALVRVMFRSGSEPAPIGTLGVTLLSIAYVGLGLSFGPLLVAFPAVQGWAVDSAAWAGLALIALPLACTWVGDASAYFVGSAIGRRPLAPTISPKKSWEGFWAGVLGAGAAAALWSVLTREVLAVPLGTAGVAGLGLLLGVAAVLGDLAESLLKREADVKDSGTFFPGHGGVLDRIDSLLFTLPLAYALVTAVGVWA
ncbi:MAG: phosphatidate cytidylyltransferase [Gemmatimonadota bacterium]